jgi:hypothetical protein
MKMVGHQAHAKQRVCHRTEYAQAASENHRDWCTPGKASGAKPLKPVNVKIPFTIAMLLTSISLFVWRLEVPNILDALSGAGLLYILLVLSLSAMVTVIGWNGASMTFPIEKE